MKNQNKPLIDGYRRRKKYCQLCEKIKHNKSQYISRMISLCLSQGDRPRDFLVLPTNKSLDLISPGKQPLIVTNGSCATASLRPRETNAKG